MGLRPDLTRSIVTRAARATWLGAGLLAVLAGLVPTTSMAQVRQMVLEDPSRPVPPPPPPRLPPREARFTPVWQIDLDGQVLDTLLAGPGGVVYALREGEMGRITADGEAAWKIQAAVRLDHAPAGIDGRLFVASRDAIAAWSSMEGDLLWSAPLESAPIASPVAGMERVFVLLGPGSLAALAVDNGARLWTRSLECSPSVEPALIGDRLLVGCREGDVLALDVADGRTRWHRHLDTAVVGPPRRAGNSIFVPVEDREVVALKSGKGRVRYRARLGARPGGPVAVRDDLVLAGAYDNHLYALRPEGGHLLWTANIGGRVTSSPAVRGHLAVSAAVLSTELVAVDLRDGAVLAREPLPGEQRLSAAAPVFAGQRLISATRPIAGGHGRLVALDVETRVVPRPGTL